MPDTPCPDCMPNNPGLQAERDCSTCPMHPSLQESTKPTCIEQILKDHDAHTDDLELKLLRHFEQLRASIFAALRPEGTITVKGHITGDGECWCLEVNESTYRRIKGDADADQELAYLQEEQEEPGAADPTSKRWLLYPDDLIGAGGRIRLTIITEELD